LRWGGVFTPEGWLIGKKYRVEAPTNKRKEDSSVGI